MCGKAPSLVTEDINILGVSMFYVGGYNLSHWIILSTRLRSKSDNLFFCRLGINCSNDDYWICGSKSSDECISAYYLCDGIKDCKVHRYYLILVVLGGWIEHSFWIV